MTVPMHIAGPEPRLRQTNGRHYRDTGDQEAFQPLLVLDLRYLFQAHLLRSRSLRSDPAEPLLVEAP